MIHSTLIIAIIIVIVIWYVLNLIIGFMCTRNLYTIRKPLRRKNGIPNIIFRTSSGLNVNKHMYNSCHQKWVTLNPHYSIVWYDNDHMDKFMARHYPGKVNSAYIKLKPGAFKADLWRLCVLYRYGGIYVDAYATPYISMNKLLERKYRFMTVLDAKQSGYGIHNGFIISESRHPFLKQAINDIVKNVENNYYGDNPLDVTGPKSLSRSINKVLNNPADKIHKVGRNEYGDLSFYLYEFRWGPRQYIYDGNTKILSKYYSFLIYLYRKLISSGYTQLWKARDIYNFKSLSMP